MAKYEPLAACCPTSSKSLWDPESGSLGPALALHGHLFPGSLAKSAESSKLALHDYSWAI